MSNESVVISAKALEENHLTGLLDHSIDVVVIPEYFSDNECTVIAEKIVTSEFFRAYPSHPMVSRLGKDLCDCNTQQAVEEYQTNAAILNQEVRQLLHPLITPIDKLRSEIDDIWSSGCTLAKINKKKLASSIVREFREQSPGEPHCDIIDWALCDELKHTTGITNQLATNLYLKVSEAGGELLLWDLWPTKSEYDSLLNSEPGRFGLDTTKLDKPKLELAPKAGDLILFNSMRVHAVKPITAGSRMTWGTLIGASEDSSPLVVWT